MKYDPSNKKPLLEAYPTLKRFEEFNDDKKLRYVIWLLDEESPLAEESDIDRRSKAAMKKCGLKIESPLEDPDIEKMICRYFILINHQTYELWFSKLVAFGETNHQIRTPVGSKNALKNTETKLKVGELSEKLRVDIMKLQLELFKDEAIGKKIKKATEARVVHYAEEKAEKDTAI